MLAGEIYTPPGFHAPRATPDSDEDLRVARRVAELTPQQFRVLGMLCSGLLNKQIAYELDVSEATVKAHVTAILRKLGVATRTQAVLAAGRLAVDRVEREAAARRRGVSQALAAGRWLASAPISARSAAGFTGLRSSGKPSSRARSPSAAE